MPVERTLPSLLLCAALLAAAGTLGAARSALAQEAEIIVAPTGADQGLVPTAAVAAGVVERLNQVDPGKRRARLVYPIPPDPPVAKAKEKQAQKSLEKVLRAFENMEYDKVGELSNDALQQYKQLLKDGVGKEGYVQCQHLMAAAALFEGASKKAFKAMFDAILFDSKAPSTKLFSPQVQELFDQVTAEPPAKGTLRLSSVPEAMVWFNGVLHGPMRGKAALRAGLYLARVYRPGYSVWQKWLRVHASQERDLAVALTKMEAPESGVLKSLRQETAEEVPGQGVQQLALENVATEVILIVAGQGCTETRCPLGLYWSKDDKWIRKVGGTYAGNVPAAVDQLLTGAGLPPVHLVVAPTGVSGQACTLDSQCAMKEKCRSGRCVYERPVTRTWWFWTIVGAVAVGTTLAIAIPVATRQGPVLEVR
jgi:hypothetical protein